MTGLLLKDYYTALRYCRIHLGVAAVMTAASLFIEAGLAYLLYPALFVGMIPVYILSVEEKCGWCRFADTLPVSRRTVVAEKYVASAILIGGAVALMTVVWGVKLLLPGADPAHAGDWHTLVRMAAQLLSFGLLFPAVTLPAMFRFGVEKGRVVTMAVAAAAAMAIVGLQFKAADIAQPDIAGAMGWHVPWIAALSAVLFGLSWLLAARLYETREL